MCVQRYCPAWRPPAASSEHGAPCLRTLWRSTRCSVCRYPTVHCGRRHWGLTSATTASRAMKSVWLVKVSFQVLLPGCVEHVMLVWSILLSSCYTSDLIVFISLKVILHQMLQNQEQYENYSTCKRNNRNSHWLLFVSESVNVSFIYFYVEFISQGSSTKTFILKNKKRCFIPVLAACYFLSYLISPPQITDISVICAMFTYTYSLQFTLLCCSVW